MFLLLEILGLCTDSRPEVRNGAIQTLFRTLQLYGATLSLATWDECVWKVTFPLLDSITSSIRQTPVLPDIGADADNEWDESKILALQFIGSILHDFLTSKIIHLPSFSKAWEVFVGHVQDSWLYDNRSISAPALRCLDKAITSLADAGQEAAATVHQALEVAWNACDEMGQAILRKPDNSESNPVPFTQESMCALIDVIRSVRAVHRSGQNREWDIERLKRLMAILKGEAQSSPGCLGRVGH